MASEMLQKYIGRNDEVKWAFVVISFPLVAAIWDVLFIQNYGVVVYTILGWIEVWQTIGGFLIVFIIIALYVVFTTPEHITPKALISIIMIGVTITSLFGMAVSGSSPPAGVNTICDLTITNSHTNIIINGSATETNIVTSITPTYNNASYWLGSWTCFTPAASVVV